ncbi:arsenite efflux transporter metallochaperone ArsD [Burkholderia vietnamiensis]|uniref:arsenite efflux transporter metallochaperone ArsD n=1 Tax=Burkholderia vietnamiensis TaxID=60552 RepID=UPI00075E38B4|nr:arsenite efflux transporter metallochaperone ArsD [Burkholderia vietnamiensis]KVS12721.1 transcriptional regulator [Burkholderia vietnamiensis]HDR8925459.1 arsenite efflux transporter metallochaperone ArsD [Burkholderia vietnamiensis]HDR9004449.1 arsenite efflux transporter metallochaperone ArsD [Burkholderia vietnamiensis]HDR9211551.1 arsenite efflux transporter metallochaperone ArsD [Burkholderia vietnamiensis]
MSTPVDEIRRAVATDFDRIVALLNLCGLPASDLAPQSLDGFHVAILAGEIVGVAGLEQSGDAALLRSVAVRPEMRQSGLGSRLIDASIALAQTRSLRALYLIPNDEPALAFFVRRGFTQIERRRLPEAIRGLPEFTHLCPQTHPCLWKALNFDCLEESAMKKLEVFDPAMCCSTGVCGVDVDPVLAQFAADLKWVEAHGVTVARYNLGQQPQAFAANAAVVKEMEAGMERLPILAIDGHIVSTGMYPSRQQLAQKLGIALTTADKPHVKAGSCCSPGSGCC